VAPSGNATTGRTAAPVIKWQSSANVKYVPGGLGRKHADYINLSPKYIDPTSDAKQGHNYGIGQDGALESKEVDDIVDRSVKDSGAPYLAGMVFQEIPAQAGFKYRFASNDYDAQVAAHDQMIKTAGRYVPAPPISDFQRWTYVEVVNSTSGTGKFSFRYSDQP
jgi:hypothetical protein